MENNTALFSSNWQHLPEGLMLPMTAHHAYTEMARYQMEASEPLKKNLWQQTVSCKILNQAGLLKWLDIKADTIRGRQCNPCKHIALGILFG